jgi:hypothetical protein
VFSSWPYGHWKVKQEASIDRRGIGPKGNWRGTLEGNKGRTMDGEVRVKDATFGLNGLYSSHTLHRNHPVDTGQTGFAETPQTRRERLIAATVEAVAEGSVDRLGKSRAATKAL